MDSLVDAGCIAMVYALFKFAEARFLKKSRADTRTVLKDAVIVAISSVIALWGAGQLGVGHVAKAPTQAFVGKPEF